MNIVLQNKNKFKVKTLREGSESRLPAKESVVTSRHTEIASLPFFSLESEQNVMHELLFIARISSMRKDEEEKSLHVFNNL